MKDEIDLLMDIEWLDLQEAHKNDEIKLLIKLKEIRKRQFDDLKKMVEETEIK